MERDFTIASARQHSASTGSRVETRHYFSGRPDAPLDRVTIKPPKYAFSDTPIPLRTRKLLSDPGDAVLGHTYTSIPDGGVLSTQSAVHSTYLHLARGARIVDDAGDHASLRASPIFQNSIGKADGTRVIKLEFQNEVSYPVTAMMLTFAPDLHTYHSHFLIQCLPRVLIARTLGANVAILVPEGLRAKQREMLIRLGITEDRLITIPRNVLVRVDNLIVPDPWNLLFSPYTVSIYDELRRTAQPIQMAVPDRVLISREQRTSWRNMNNFDAIKNVLVHEHAFQLIRPELLSLDEEIAVFQNADIIAGAEGAGLYSSVFSGKTTTVVSISDEDYSMRILGSAAAHCGFEICSIVGESFRSDHDVARILPNGHCDFIVDPALVSQAIRAVIRHSN